MRLIDDEERQIVKQALRHYVQSSEVQAEQHRARGYTAASHVYAVHAAVVRSVLLREFDDRPPR